jgi:hypothetical protein
MIYKSMTPKVSSSKNFNKIDKYLARWTKKKEDSNY